MNSGTNHSENPVTRESMNIAYIGSCFLKIPIALSSKYPGILYIRIIPTNVLK